MHESMKPQPPIMSYPSSDFAAPDMGAALQPVPPPKSLAASEKEVTEAASNYELIRKKTAQKKAKYQSIISLHQKETPCETTMIPFLSELCSREIEEELVTIKRFIDMIGREDNFKEPVDEDVTAVAEKSKGRSTGQINHGKNGSGSGSAVAIASTEKGSGTLEGNGDKRKRKPLKMFFKNLFHAQVGPK
ncbi:UNVERIFIED_CONTAM: hypothetical protein HDU68_007683 [Siphonaria sp. JEL0065]|nr:hypothetical protein HDU68_007683 [Siphonaria sp. JEL0065]